MTASWTPQSIENEESYEHRLLPIFTAINAVRMAIGEILTSTDLDIFTFECDKTYDPVTMDDAYSGGKQSGAKRAPEAIVGTIGIGFGKLIAEGISTSSANLKGRLQHEVVIPAKIMLRSTLNEDLTQPNKLRKKKKKMFVAEP